MARRPTNANQLFLWENPADMEVRMSSKKTPRDCPPRPRFFALHFLRRISKVCLANEIGVDACWLLTVIVNTQDARGYRGPVTFFNGQLMAMLGVKSQEALAKIRDKAVKSGWLSYIPGGKGIAGMYWVEVPDMHADWDDAPSDEGTIDDLAASVVGAFSPREIEAQVERNAGKKSSATADHSSSSCSYSKNPPTPLPGGGEGFDELLATLAEVTGLDPVTAARPLGRALRLLRSASPPYTPAEVSDFGARYWRLCPTARDRREKPGLGELTKNIGRLRDERKRSAASASDAQRKAAAKAAEEAQRNAVEQQDRARRDQEALRLQAYWQTLSPDRQQEIDRLAIERCKRSGDVLPADRERWGYVSKAKYERARNALLEEAIADEQDADTECEILEPSVGVA